MTDIASTIVRNRRWIALCFTAIALLLLPLAPQTSSRLEVGGAKVDRSEAVRVDTLLATRFVTPFANSLLLVATGMPDLEDVDGVDVLLEIVDAVEANSSVKGVSSYLDTAAPRFLSPQGTFVLVGIDAGERRMDEVVLDLRKTTQLLQARLRENFPMIELSWTGAAAFDYDLRLTSSKDAAEAEQRVLPVTLLLLFVVFGSVVSALCPMIIGGLGVGISLGLAVLISSFWPLTILLQNIVAMIGLGIGIDYSLLMLSRFREEMSVDNDPERAATETVRTAGHTVLLSGGAVVIGFAALLLIPATELRSIAMGGLLVVAFSLALATLLLPGLLCWLGSRVEAGRLWKPQVEIKPPKRWLAWGRWVVAHPVLVLLIAGLPLAGLAWQARHISTDIPTGSWLPDRMESTRGAAALHQMGHGGIAQIIRVLVEFPNENTANSEQGWESVLQLGSALATDDRVARVESLPRLLGIDAAHQVRIAAVIASTPIVLRDAYIGQKGRLSLIEIIPHDTESTGSLMRYVRELRMLDATEISGLEGARLLIGGLPAHNADYQDAIGGNAVNVVLFVVLGSFMALLLGFHSLLGALKAVTLNLLSVSAAMGVTVLVFQQGYGSEWLGVEYSLEGLFPAVPIIVFCVVYGLSMDYEVFLLSRVAEGVCKGMSNTDALIDGLARTAGVITSAALVMIIVFVGFSLGDFLIIKILGFSLAVAILIDATLVRLAIGPALLQLGGRWNWWPGSM